MTEEFALGDDVAVARARARVQAVQAAPGAAAESACTTIIFPPGPRYFKQLLSARTSLQSICVRQDQARAPRTLTARRAQGPS